MTTDRWPVSAPKPISGEKSIESRSSPRLSLGEVKAKRETIRAEAIVKSMYGATEVARKPRITAEARAVRTIIIGITKIEKATEA